MLILSLLGFSCASRVTPSAAPPDTKVYSWLINQQRDTGILGNQEGSDFSAVYPNALAAMCFLYRGDVRRAERIFDFFNRHFDQEFAEGGPGGFHQFWDAGLGTVHADSDRWVGDNAWLLIALNYYRRKTDRNDFDKMRRGIAKWLIGLQDEDGGILSGFNKKGPMTHKSTEANLDCYAALADYPEQQARIRDWLGSQMWVADEKRFRMGSTVDETPLDVTPWGIAALGREYADALDYTEKHFVRTDASDVTGKNVNGFSDFLGKHRIWLEGTGQMVVAYHVLGEKEKALRYLMELETAMVPSEALPGAVGLPCSTSDPAWEGASRKIFVPSQAWYLFGKYGFNPMSTAN